METVPRTTTQEHAFAWRQLERASAWIIQRTIPLFAVAPQGNPVVEGSGVLLQIADSFFLLSAAHVIAGVIQDQRALLAGVHGSPLVSLEGCEVHVSDDHDDIDVAFIRLPHAQAMAIAKLKSFVRLSEVDVERRAPRIGSYAVVGFPRGLQTFESRQINAEPFRLITELFNGELDRFTPGQSIAVLFQPRALADERGRPTRAPALGGISGCGIWRIIGPEDGTPGQSWQPERTIRLAGIEHGTIGDAVKGLLAFRVIDAIQRHHPDLAPAIAISRP